MQGGYTKYPCFLCKWDSRADEKHYQQRHWPSRDNFQPGSHNIVSMPLIPSGKVLLPPLHIKLGLMKNFIKAMNKDGAAFQYVQIKFSFISDAKIKAGIFDGPQIRTLMNDVQFENAMTLSEKNAWQSFKSVVKDFLGNRRNADYKAMIDKLIETFKDHGSRMSIKMHLLWSHLDYFPENCGDYSEEQGERFHQDIRTMEERYQGNWDINMLADYCWCLKRDLPNENHKRRSKKVSFLPK